MTLSVKLLLTNIMGAVSELAPLNQSEGELSDCARRQSRLSGAPARRPAAAVKINRTYTKNRKILLKNSKTALLLTICLPFRDNFDLFLNLNMLYNTDSELQSLRA